MKKIAVFIFAASLILSSCGRKKVINQFDEVNTPTVAAKKEEKSYFDFFNQGWGWVCKNPGTIFIVAGITVVAGFGVYKLFKYYYPSKAPNGGADPLNNLSNDVNQPQEENAGENVVNPSAGHSSTGIIRKMLTSQAVVDAVNHDINAANAICLRDTCVPSTAEQSESQRTKYIAKSKRPRWCFKR